MKYIKLLSNYIVYNYNLGIINFDIYIIKNRNYIKFINKAKIKSLLR